MMLAAISIELLRSFEISYGFLLRRSRIFIAKLEDNKYRSSGAEQFNQPIQSCNFHIAFFIVPLWRDHWYRQLVTPPFLSPLKGGLKGVLPFTGALDMV